jgi:hypothetical protein
VCKTHKPNPAIHQQRVYGESLVQIFNVAACVVVEGLLIPCCNVTSTILKTTTPSSTSMAGGLGGLRPSTSMGGGGSTRQSEALNGVRVSVAKTFTGSSGGGGGGTPDSSSSNISSTPPNEAFFKILCTIRNEGSMRLQLLYENTNSHLDNNTPPEIVSHLNQLKTNCMNSLERAGVGCLNMALSCCLKNIEKTLAKQSKSEYQPKDINASSSNNNSSSSSSNASNGDGFLSRVSLSASQHNSKRSYSAKEDDLNASSRGGGGGEEEEDDDEDDDDGLDVNGENISRTFVALSKLIKKQGVYACRYLTTQDALSYLNILAKHILDAVCQHILKQVHFNYDYVVVVVVVRAHGLS